MVQKSPLPVWRNQAVGNVFSIERIGDEFDVRVVFDADEKRAFWTFSISATEGKVEVKSRVIVFFPNSEHRRALVFVWGPKNAKRVDGTPLTLTIPPATGAPY